MDNILREMNRTMQAQRYKINRQVQQYKINDIIVDVVKNRCGVLYIRLQEQKNTVILSTGEIRRIIKIIQQEVK